MIKRVGTVIKERREEIGLTKTQLAKKLGCSPQNIDSIEKRKSIDFELAIKISEILDFDIFESYRPSSKAIEPSPSYTEINEDHRKLKEKYRDLLEKYSQMLEDSLNDFLKS